MNNQLTKFQKQSITVYDKNGEIIPNRVTGKKNNLPLIVLSFVCAILVCTTFYLLTDNYSQETNLETVAQIDNNKPNTDEVFLSVPADIDTTYIPKNDTKKTVEFCGVVIEKGFEITSEGKNLWFKIKKEENGEIVKVDNIPSVVWTYSEDGITEFCK